jgi:hypothetical protein
MFQIQFIFVKKLYQILGIILFKKSKLVGFMLKEHFFLIFLSKMAEVIQKKDTTQIMAPYIGLLIPLETTP